MYEMIGTFAAGLGAGIIAGIGAAYAYWRKIPKAKKKAAFVELRKGLSDRRLSIDEVMVAAEQLF
jgi:hypothetical protein